MNEEELDAWYDSSMIQLQEEYIERILDQNADKEKLKEEFRNKLGKLRKEYEKKSNEIIEDEKIISKTAGKFKKTKEIFRKLTEQFRE
ncbi:hypothetical protein JXA85_01005 [Candidatus Woesearchaeota archaeon]|nr:hypothetical protein [Candidatus Woesearchaeota archaeon]